MGCIDKTPMEALCAKAMHGTRGLRLSDQDPPGSVTVMGLLAAMDDMRDLQSLGSPTYVSTFNYGGERDVPWEWMNMWAWVHGIEDGRMDMICNPVYLTNIVRCWDGDEACTVGTTVKYAGLPPSHHLEGDVLIDDPTSLAADFLWNVVKTLGLREPDDIRAFLTAPLKEGQRLELLAPDEVDELLAHGVHLVPDPEDASDTAAMVKNATACMNALSMAIEGGAQNA